MHSVKFVYMPFLLHIVPYTESPVIMPPDPFVACCEKSTSPGHGLTRLGVLVRGEGNLYR